MQRITLFLCYSDKDKIIAGLFKKYFERITGFSVFLAHVDIDPSTQWNIEIIRNLKHSDVFVPIISSDSIVSAYCNQEIGMAIALGKKIIPIKISRNNPPGFITTIQAFRYNGSVVEADLIKSVTEIYYVFIKNSRFKKYKEKALYSIIHSFSKSDCFETTHAIMAILRKLDEEIVFDSEQLDFLISAIQKNRNIYEEKFGFPSYKRGLERKYKVEIDI